MIRPPLTVAFIALLLALAGCGGGGDDDSLADAMAAAGPAEPPVCPADPATFVGPLPEWCLWFGLHRRTPRIPHLGEGGTV